MRKIGILLLSCFAAFQLQALPFTLSSSDLEIGKTISEKFTCDGKDISPILTWEHPPVGTHAFAVVVDDLDSAKGNWTHWVIYNLPIHNSGLMQGVQMLPQPAIVLPNSWGKRQYSGPCPPTHETHRYRFTVYALDDMLSLRNVNDFSVQLAKHTLATSSIIKTYSR